MRRLTHVERLEAESIHIFREVVADAENQVMLYSVGEDSSVMLHLARKAFYPTPRPSRCCTLRLDGILPICSPTMMRRCANID